MVLIVVTTSLAVVLLGLGPTPVYVCLVAVWLIPPGHVVQKWLNCLVRLVERSLVPCWGVPGPLRLLGVGLGMVGGAFLVLAVVAGLRVGSLVSWLGKPLIDGPAGVVACPEQSRWRPLRRDRI